MSFYGARGRLKKFLPRSFQYRELEVNRFQRHQTF